MPSRRVSSRRWSGNYSCLTRGAPKRRRARRSSTTSRRGITCDASIPDWAMSARSSTNGASRVQHDRFSSVSTKSGQVQSFLLLAVFVFLLSFRFHAVEEIDNARFERILSADNEQALVANQVLEHFRAVAKVIHRRPDVGANGLFDQRVVVVSKVRRKQRFD